MFAAAAKYRPDACAVIDGIVLLHRDNCKDFVINEFEKKSAALVDYLNSLECAYERLRLEAERQKLDCEHREAQLKREKAELKYMLESALERDRRLEHDKCVLLKEKERLLERIQELEARIDELQREMHRREELYQYRKKRDEKARRKLDIENKALKKKATVGWMLGSLCEVYLEGGADGGTLPLILMLRKLQKDLERETVSCDAGLKVSTDSLKREVNKLLRSTSGSRSPRVEVRIQDHHSRPGSPDDIGDHRRKPCRSVSPKGRSPSCTRSPFCPRPPSPFSQRTRSPMVSPRSTVSPRGKSPMSPRDRSPLSQRCRSPYSPRARSMSRSPSPLSPCSHKTKSRSPSPCTTLTVNFDSDMPEEPVGHYRCTSQPGVGHVDTVEISRDECRKKNWAEIKVIKEPDEGGTDIKHMLSNIEANINYLLDSERKRRWRESQFRNIGYSPRSRTVRDCCKPRVKH
ncbi:hypothetical protein SELMODRAFT_440925 [Selaginella moellendorffii]|uniref:Uncharacterized protein n=2 Tax=Selaginella moellendorffii TaxID=88036 RepID=D8RFF5_SELML|nr:hypothetical protein SELMODRAFT_440925 [Selaginella moellendorffii]